MNVHVAFSDRHSTRQCRALALANYIERSDTFNMATWQACVAGKCADMIGADRDEGFAAADYLGLKDAEPFHLFTPKGAMLPDSVRYEIDYLAKIDKAWAVRTLRYFAFTGKIDWIANEAARPSTSYSRLRMPSLSTLPPCSIREAAYLA